MLENLFINPAKSPPTSPIKPEHFSTLASCQIYCPQAWIKTMQIFPNQPLYILHCPSEPDLVPFLTPNFEIVNSYDFCAYTTKELANSALELSTEMHGPIFKIRCCSGIELLKWGIESEVDITNFKLFHEDCENPVSISMLALLSTVTEIDIERDPIDARLLGRIKIGNNCSQQLQNLFEKIGGVDSCLIASINDGTERLYVLLVGDTQIGAPAWSLPIKQILRDERLSFSELEISIASAYDHYVLAMSSLIVKRGGVVIDCYCVDEFLR